MSKRILLCLYPCMLLMLLILIFFLIINAYFFVKLNIFFIFVT